MIDWNRWGKIPNNDIEQYPTIIDILQDIIREEESHTLNRYPLLHQENALARMMKEGYYLLMTSDSANDEVELMPTSRTPMVFYRGQNKFFPHCVSSLCREKDTEKELMRSRLQICELQLCLISHPVIWDFIIKRFSYDNKLFDIKIPVHIEGLAQHYGIKTTLLDLTADKWVAAFFATTIYKNGIYSPVDTSDEKCPKYGVFYRYRWALPTGNVRNNDIHAIGIQYFNRPGKQSAIVMNLPDGKDFNQVDGVERIFFRHDLSLSKLVYDLSQQSRKFFPDDLLANMMCDFLNKPLFSLEAAELCRTKYYPRKNKEDYYRAISNCGFMISEHSQLSFNQEETKKEYEYWEREGRERYFRQLLVLPLRKF